MTTQSKDDRTIKDDPTIQDDRTIKDDPTIQDDIVQETDLTVTFGPAPGDRATLSKTSGRTLEAIYQHPLSHNLEWSDVVALFEKLGTVERKPHDEIAFGIAGERHLVRKPHRKDVTTDDVMAFRHMLTKAGWAPVNDPQPHHAADVTAPPKLRAG